MKARKSQGYRIELEGLEARTLLATIPAAAPTAVAPTDISSLMGNVGGVNSSQNSSAVAVDPLDPSKLVAVWIDNDPQLYADTDNTIESVLEAAYSNDGGTDWNVIYAEPIVGLSSAPTLFNPATNDPVLPYEYVSSPSVGFDDSGNVYMLSEYSGGTSGALVLEKFKFTGSAPTSINFTSNTNPSSYVPSDAKVIYQWVSTGTGDAAYDPTMAVDDNLATIPSGVESPPDPNSGDVYVSWASVDVNQALNPQPFNPNRIMVEVSSDGGNNFGPATIAGADNYNTAAEKDGTPALTVSQGRLPSESGQSGDVGIAAGQVAVTYDDFGDNPQQIGANSIAAGSDNSFGDQTEGIIAEAADTSFAISVGITNTTGLDTLNVTVNIVDTSDNYLGLVLIAPSGDELTLLDNQTVGSFTDPGIGIGGTNLGVVADNGYVIGTTFTDIATRDIQNDNATGTNVNTGPAIGDYRIENAETLDGFLAAQLKTPQGVNGTWTLVAVDTHTPTTSPPATPSFLVNWSLSFGHGLGADTPVTLPVAIVPLTSEAGAGYAAIPIAGGVNPATAPKGLSVPSSAVQIGPGLVMAQDNTLGAFSPYEGRIYVAYVAYVNSGTINGFKNPASNTDIFLTYSDDDGRIWSTPVEVNNDSSAVDGITGSNETNFFDEVTGNSQYQPEVAVDPTTGTLVLSWRDARNDPADVLVATYIATSIDGGNTFSAQVYANPQNTATDGITGQTDVISPEADDGTTASSAAASNGLYSFGSSMGLAVYGGQVYPIWAANFDEAHLVNGAAVGNGLFIYYQPMAIAAGPRIISSTMGPIADSTDTVSGTLLTGSSLVTGLSTTTGLYAGESVSGTGISSGAWIEAVTSSTSITLSSDATVSGVQSLTASADGYQQAEDTGQLSFTVTFDRPIDPGYGQTGVTPGSPTWSFYTADVQVFYQDAQGDGLVPLTVNTVTPVASSGIGPTLNGTGSNSTDPVFGYTEFTITFNPLPPGASPTNYNYVGTYSYLITPDDENSDPVEEPIPSFVYSEVTEPQVQFASRDVPQPIPPNAQEGVGPGNDITTSTLAINGEGNNVITGATVTLSLSAPTASGNQLIIYLTAPDGQQGIVYDGTVFAPAPLNFVNQSFPVFGLAGSKVNGTYTLTVFDEGNDNTGGSLTSWSLSISSYRAELVLQPGDAMDQNANGISDENPINTNQFPAGYTGLTPGDIYAVSAPDPTLDPTLGQVTFTTAQSILTSQVAPLNPNTLPLIISGPQILTTQAVGSAGEDSTGTANLLTNDSSSQFDVIFDRPVQVGSFTPTQVLSIMGPAGSILTPQTIGSTTIDQQVNAATASGPGTLDSTLTVNSDNTLQIGDITVTLTIAALEDSGLTAVLEAPNGDMIPLFAAVGGASNQGFVNTTFSDSAATSITTGKAPFTGSFIPEYKANSKTLTDLQGLIADGTWHLLLTNTTTGATATLDSWSLNITPQIAINPLNESTVNGTEMATEFAVLFPQQQVSGTYTIQLGPDILDQFGDGQDPTSSAGLDVIRGVGQNSPTTTMQYNAPLDIPMPIPASAANSLGQTVNGTLTSSISVPDSFVISGDQTAAGLSVIQVELDASFPADADLTATLTHLNSLGNVVGTVTLFSGVGTGKNTANFTNTVFDDNASTPIQNGSAPFSAIYNPQESLATAFAPIAGQNVQGTWELTITNNATGASGTLNGWSLTFQKPILNNGLGEQGSDDATVSFQIFTLSPTDPVSSEAWTPVGPASSTYEAGQVNAIAVDPSDASGNTVYVGGASGGIWKTTDFLTTSPDGPTWIPLTNFGPNAAINIASITIFPVNDNPDQSIIIAATGDFSSAQEGFDAPGVGFLISTNGGTTWNLDDSTDNVSSVNDTASEIGDTSNILPINSAARNREFVGTTAYQVTVDPELTPTGQVIIYAALSGAHGGIWESQNTGQTWTQVLAGNATSVVLDQNSGLTLDPNAAQPPGTPGNPAGTPTYAGNYQIVYAGFETPTGSTNGTGEGVYISTNQGQSWTLMKGGVGNPTIYDAVTDKNVNPLANPTPNTGGGKVVLTVPAATNNYAESELYAGWLYAAVATPSGAFDGLFITKDFGANWTQIQLDTLPAIPTEGDFQEAIPIQPGAANGDGPIPYSITDLIQGNVDLALTIDPQNPNITYLGGFGGNGYNSDTGLIRVDATNLDDDDSLIGVLFDSQGNLTLKSSGWTTIDGVVYGQPSYFSELGLLVPADYLNLERDPFEPFLVDSTLLAENVAAFTNSGDNATWTPFDVPTTGVFNPPGEITGTLTANSDIVTGISSTTGLEVGDDVTGAGLPVGTYITDIDSSTSITLSEPSTVSGVEGLNNEISGTGYQVLVAEVDPATGLTRLIAGNLTGIYSGLDDNGTFEATIGTSTPEPGVNRNGNLDLAQVYYGAVQPSSAAAQVAGALFYAGAQNIGGQASDPNLLTDGNLQWNSIEQGGSYLNASGTAVDQQGNGTLFQYWSPGQGGGTFDSYTAFVQVNDVGRTYGLLQASNGGDVPDPQWGGTSYANLVVNPVDSDDDLVSSTTGNLFETTNQGETWFDIGTPTTFGSPGETSFALAFGAPDPSAPSGVGNLGNFIYVGTFTGKIYVSQSAGGNWTSISTGLDGSPVQEIITDPNRGSHDAYAVTEKGVYYMANSVAANPTWVNITGGLKSLAYTIFGQNYDPATDPNTSPYDLASVINSIEANWNYTIPNSSGSGFHPVLYVAANSGVYMSTNNGTTWTLFPDTTFGALTEGGDLPDVNVTDLALSQGDIATASGMPSLAGPYQTLTFSGTLASGLATVTGVVDIRELAVGDYVAGPGIPAGTTIKGIGTTSITLSAKATATGEQSLDAADPTAVADPDLLLASTYGEGEFAINLAPMLFPSTVGIVSANGSITVPTPGGTPPTITTATPSIGGESEISGLGSTTWVSIIDETSTDPTFGQVIGGFNPQTYDNGQSIIPNASNSTNALGGFAIMINAGVFTSNGLKTVEVETTDDAGAVSNKVMVSFTLDVPNITPPPAPTAPTTPTLSLATSTPGYYGKSLSPVLTGTTTPGATVDLYAVSNNTTTLEAKATADGNGNFTLTFTGTDDTTYTVEAQASNTVGTSGFSNEVTFEILFGPPAAPTGLSLAPSSDTGIVGDDITADHRPVFTGTTGPNSTIELLAAGQTSPVYGTATANSSGQFSISFANNLSDGTVSVDVVAVDPAGNISAPSDTLTVTIVSVASDYNGDSYSDAALYSRGTIGFAGTLTSGSPVLSGLGSLTGLVKGAAISGTGIPSGTTISNVVTVPFTATLTTGSSLVTGLNGTKGLFAGENISGTGIPAGATIAVINNPTSITLSTNATASGSQNLTAIYITLSANATASGPQSLAAGVGIWLVQNTSDVPANSPSPPFWFPNGTAYFGPSNVTPFQGDFDGDGLTDLAYYQSSTATWYIDYSQNNTVVSFALGTPNVSVPVVGYFSPNGPEEAAVFTQGVWTIAGNSNTVSFGQAGDIPVPGDYTGIGYDELAVYRPSTGQFFVLVPQANGAPTTITITIPGISSSPDLASLVPVPGNYDPYEAAAGWVENVEAAVFDPNTGVYTILGPSGNPYYDTFAPGDIPAPADYLGNGSIQPVVFRPSTGQFIEVDGTVIATFGQASAEIPLAAPLSYRAAGDTDPPTGSPGTSPGTGTGTGTGTTTGTGTGTTTGTGTGTTTGTTAGTGSGSSSSGQGSGSATTTTSTTPVVTSSVPGTSSHKKKASKKKSAPHKKAPKPKKHETPAKPKRHVVVSHPASKAITVTTAHTALAQKPTHVVDLALEDIHVHLRRSFSGKKG